jgi:hypothetical protein
MPITPYVAVQQTALSPNIITLVDESTGSDVTITKRRVFITDAYGNYLVPSGTTTDYIEWDDFPATTTLVLNLLTEDTAANLLVQYLTAGDVVVTDFEDDYPFSEYNKQFFYELWQQQSLNPSILQDSNYATNLANLWVAIIGGIQCVEIASDLAASQNAMNIATNYRLNQSKYF